MKNDNKNMKTLVGYGINVKFKRDDAFSRYTTVDQNSIVLATEIFKVLSIDNELELWDNVEVEKIFETQDGDFEYETIMTAEVK